MLDSQRIIYGTPVKENPEEVANCYHALQSLFTEKQGKLNHEEIQLFSQFLGEIKEEYQLSDNTIPKKSPKASRSDGEKKFEQAQIKALSHQIMNFYTSYFQSPELNRWKVKEQRNSSALNISGTYEILNIPEKYEATNHNKVTQTIIGHEIEQHLFHWVNNNKPLGTGFTSGKYDFISEGVAKLNEDLVSGKLSKLEDLPLLKEGASIGLIGVFICERLPFDDAVKILKSYFKMKGNEDAEAEKKAITTVQRRKRFVAKNLPGSSIKDTLYQRGKNRVIDYLLEEGTLQGAIERYKNLNILKV